MAVQIALKPAYYYPYKIRGWVYCDRKEYEKAIEDFTKAINSLADGVEDEAAVVYDLRGRCYRAISQEDCADSDFAKAKELRNTKAERERRYQRLL